MTEKDIRKLVTEARKLLKLVESMSWVFSKISGNNIKKK